MIRVASVVRTANARTFGAVLDNTLGEHHTPRHRMVFGGMVGLVGVGISKSFPDVHYWFVHFMTDGVGYMVHGIGCIPFVDYLLSRIRAQQAT